MEDEEEGLTVQPNWRKEVDEEEGKTVQRHSPWLRLLDKKVKPIVEEGVRGFVKTTRRDELLDVILSVHFEFLAVAHDLLKNLHKYGLKG